ncbi:MAG: fumarylacetoacetase [Salinibacter sp.]|uniref:fumarylacetoacetase n=1 Tax=Salinibacter sp. TaxID=2065818 RepID=UPI0035D3E362
MSDSTTDPSLSSFLDVDANHPFPIQNLPYGVFTPPASTVPRVGVAIGDHVLDLAVLNEEGALDVPEIRDAHPFAQGTLNAFMDLGTSAWTTTRNELQRLLRADTPKLRDDTSLRERVLHPRTDVSLQLPVDIGDYTDFYSSKQHARNVGTMFRGPENALKDNWVHLPVGYHGRASSVILSGQDVQRPCGQTRPDADEPPIYGPSQLLDFELETGFFVGDGNDLGSPIPIDEASDHIFGMVLVNDWSARDIQGWEYEPLGPFLGKSFATTISPWVVPMEALEPFRTDGPSQDPEPLDYLQADGDAAYDITLEVGLQTPSMADPHTVCRTNFRYLYWTMRQQLAHHTVNGCNVRPGDLLASGTISGPTEDSYGSMLELSWRGEEPVSLPGDERRSFLNDGDRVVMRGYAQGDGYRIGFGTAEGTVRPAPCA